MRGAHDPDAPAASHFQGGARPVEPDDAHLGPWGEPATGHRHGRGGAVTTPDVDDDEGLE